MAHPMRIAIVTDFYYPTLGGISEHVDGQARALTELGHEVTVVTGRKLGAPPVQDDAMAVPERPNMPATTYQWPNWSIALPEPIETLKSNRLAASIARALGRRPRRTRRRGR